MNPLTPKPRISTSPLQQLCWQYLLMVIKQFAIAKRTKKSSSFYFGWEKYILSCRQRHLDFRIGDRYNLAPSKYRAMSTRNYLLQQGIKPERITIRLLVESKLKKLGNTIDEHAYNRRMNVIVRNLRSVNIIFKEQDRNLQLEKQVNQ